jgi:alcohol oxidase
MPCFEGELIEGNPKFAEGSTAAYKDFAPVDINAPEIVYSAEDDKAIDTYLRENGVCLMPQTFPSIIKCSFGSGV